MSGWVVAENEKELRIEIVLHDLTTHKVAPQALDVLLENDRVLKFRRTDGWAQVGIDPVRMKRPEAEPVYTGPERRTRH